jgi:hypothetical protein
VNQNATIEQAAFSVGAAPWLYNEDLRQLRDRNEYVRGTGQGEAMHRKYKRLKLGSGQAYDRSCD